MTIEQRIDRVEKQNRRLKWAMTALCVVAVGAFVVGQKAPEDVIRIEKPDVLADREVPLGAGAIVVERMEPVEWLKQVEPEMVPDVIRAKHFEVVNDTGKVLIELGPTKGGAGGIILFDPSDSKRQNMPTVKPK